MAALLTSLEEKHPNIRSVMLAALSNVRPTHLLDRDLASAWNERPEHIRPKASIPRRAGHAPALPTDARKLPIVMG